MKYYVWRIFGFQLFLTLSLFGQNRDINPIKPCSPPKSAECQSNQQERDAINLKKENTKTFGDSLLPNIKSEFRTKLSLVVKEKVKITKDEQKSFASQLADKDIKVIKLWNNVCSAGDLNTFDVSLENCADKFDFWKASVYSFYKKDYKSFFATISVTNNRLVAKNERNQIMAEVSDISIGSIDADTKSVLTLNSFEFKPDKTVEDIAQNLPLAGLKIVFSENIIINKTYLLRSMFNDNSLASGFTKVDKTYAFQIIKIEDNFITVVWKEIKLKKTD
jgi:hypothetical protein